MCSVEPRTLRGEGVHGGRCPLIDLLGIGWPWGATTATSGREEATAPNVPKAPAGVEDAANPQGRVDDEFTMEELLGGDASAENVHAREV